MFPHPRDLLALIPPIRKFIAVSVPFALALVTDSDLRHEARQAARYGPST